MSASHLQRRSGVPKWGIRDFYPQNCQNWTFTTDAEYVANLVGLNVNVWLQSCNSAVHNDIFISDIVGYDRLKFS